MVPGMCPPLGSCTFEDGYCTWENSENSDDFDWMRSAGESMSADTGPTTDHTLGTEYGVYLLMDASTPQVQGDMAKLFSVRFDNSQPRCMQFFYFMKSKTPEGIGTLEVVQYWDSDYNYVMWEDHFSYGDVWIEAMVDLPNNVTQDDSYVVQFRAYVGSSAYGDVAIDDITITDGSCAYVPTRPTECALQCDPADSTSICIPNSAVCDFNMDCPAGVDEQTCGQDCTFDGDETCRWNDESSGTFRWGQSKGATPDENTGPSGDHTSGSGYYMYVDASSGSTGNQAYLVGPEMQSSGPYCEMTLFYHMYGDHIGTLQASKRINNVDNFVWARVGSQANDWYQGRVKLGRNIRPFQMVLAASRSFDVLGDIAVDDIKFENCELPPIETCSSDQFQCDRGSCVDPKRLCDYTDDCGDSTDETNCDLYIGRCDFEQGGWCDWTQSLTDDFDWTLASGFRCRPETGPCVDHTRYTRDGHYLFIDSTNQESEDLAQLLSPTLITYNQADADACSLRLHYHMYGENIRRLSVHSRTQDGGPLNERIWSTYAYQGDFWERIEVPLEAVPNVAFQVIIEAMAPNSDLGDIAIDDISFSPSCKLYGGNLPPGTTVPTTTVSPCPAQQFHCGDETCISLDKHCDGTFDCLDGRDEMFCGDCNFDTSTCGWFDDSSGSYKWDRIQGTGTSDVTTGPIGDHTDGQGWYMFVDPSSGDFMNYAHLISPILPQSLSSCSINFWYYLYSSSSAQFDANIAVIINNQAGSQLIWSKSTNQGNQWVNADIPLGVQEHGHNIVIQSYHGSNGANVAVDDIRFINCHQSTGVQCDIGDFQCTNGGCVKNVYRCDFVDDCGDNSDELGCPDYLACDFNTDTCEWTMDASNTLTLQRGVLSDPTAPSSDHNSNIGGSYLYVKATSLNTNTIARLNGPLINPVEASACEVRIYRNIHGANVGRIDVSIRTATGDVIPVTSLSDVNNDLLWHRSPVNVGSNQYFQIVVDVVRGTAPSGAISLDDVSMSVSCPVQPDAIFPCAVGSLPCDNGVCIAPDKFCNFVPECTDGSDEVTCPISCNLENGFCGWLNDESNYLRWIRQQGVISSPVGQDGPATDHNPGTSQGYFAIVKSTGGSLGQTSKLLSAQYTQAGLTCTFSFYYNIYGAFARFSVRTVTSSGTIRELWQPNSGSQQNQWIRADVNLPTCLKDFKVIFQVDVITNDPGSVAIDDLNFNNCDYPDVSQPETCDANSKQCGSGHCVAADLWCDFNYDCCDETDEDAFECASYARCNFERDYCEWTKLSPQMVSPPDWTVGKSPSNNPSFDHTSGTSSGQYVYIDGSTMTGGVAAQLQSFVHSPESVNCYMRFYSYVYGSGSTLKVVVVSDAGEDLKKTIPSDTTSQWKRNSVLVTPVTSTFQVVLEGMLGTTLPAVIAVDDVSFSEGCIKSPTGGPIIPGGGTTAPPYVCSPTSYYCDNDVSAGICIDPKKECDFNRDCPNSDDERNCPTSCDFEGTPGFDGGECGWAEDIAFQLDSFNWVVSKASAATQPFGPPYDLTTGSPNGGYAYIQKTGFQNQQVAVFASQFYQQAHSTCKFHFFYYQIGLSVGQLDVIMTTENEETLMMRIQDDQGSQWNQMTLDIGRRTLPFQISIVKQDEGQYDGQTAIDNMRLSLCSTPIASAPCSGDNSFLCPTTKACLTKHNVICDGVDDCGDYGDEANCQNSLLTTFESGWGGWSNENTYDQFDWLLNQGPVDTVGTGPYRDHTTATKYGFYAYADSSAPRESGDRAWLNSPLIDVTTDNCELRFWYLMDGIDVYRLSAYMKTASNGEWSHLWDSPGDINTVWQKASVYLSSNKPFQVVIEAVIGKGIYADIAIDDISFSYECSAYTGILPTLPNPELPSEPLPPGSCDADQEYECRQTSVCISTSKICDFRSDCSDGSDESSCVPKTCDFESGLCRWQISPDLPPGTSDTFTWVRGRSSGSSVVGRLSGDHSSSGQTGFYLYANSKGVANGQSTQFYSTNITKSGPQCTLRFFYWMGDSDTDSIGSLHVFALPNDNNNLDNYVELWSRNGYQGGGWIEGRAFVGYKNNFQVVVETRRQDSQNIDISIDDLEFVDCEPPIALEQGCASTDFTCLNGACIDSSLMCDFSDNCGDGSDEDRAICYTKKPRCDFEHDICEFERQNAEMQWQLVSSGSITDGSILPAHDHTLRRADGHFMFADPMTSVDPTHNGKAWFGTPGLFVMPSTGCMVRFYYNIWSNTDVLSVYVRTDWQSDSSVGFNLMYSTAQDPTSVAGQFWQRAEILLSANQDFQVVFEATHTSGGYTSSVAIDDVSFSDECLYNEKGAHGDIPTPTTPPSSCSAGYYACLNGNCYDESQRCDFIDACKDSFSPNPPSDESTCGSTCTFDSSSCGWKNSDSASYNFDWSRASGSSASGSDHTTGTSIGYYMKVNTGSLSAVGAKAHLTTDVYKRSSSSCAMKFYYKMTSSAGSSTDIGSLRVLKKTSQPDPATLLNVENAQGSSWIEITVHVGMERSFEIVFEVINGASNGYILVDDVTFQSCGDTSAQSCGADLFSCASGECLYLDEVCDMRGDCSDGSDELSCTLKTGDCTFDGETWSSGCSYIQNQDDDADWSLSDGSDMSFTNPLTSGPAADHTPNTDQGSFAVVNVENLNIGDIARFTTGTSTFPQSIDICTLRFWYFISGTSASTILRVYVVSATGGRHLAVALYGQYGATQEWQYASVPLSSTDLFRVQFEAEAGRDAPVGGVIAVDDATFTQACRDGASATPAPVVCSGNQFSCINDGKSECMPNTWKCDGYNDCSDGTDELGCPPVTNPGTTPSQNTGQCKDNEFRCADDVCIPGLLSCDGVEDCSNGEDENGCPDVTCASDQFFCKDNTGACYDSSIMCDGYAACQTHQADESLCGSCPDDYCQNGGNCVTTALGGPTCLCATGFVGQRCSHEKDVTTSKPPGLNSGAIVGIVFGCIIAIILIGGAGFYFIRKNGLTGRPGKGLARSYDNPIFDTPYGSSSFGKGSSKGQATEMTESTLSRESSVEAGFSNPGYSEGLQTFGEAAPIYATLGKGPSRQRQSSEASA